MRTLLILAVLASPAFAQDVNRGNDWMVNRLKERLGLSEEQTAKVKEIYSKDSEDRTKLDDARTEKINALLSDEQKKQYEELRAQFRNGFRGFGGGAPGGPGGGFQFQNRAMGQVQLDDVKRDLNLTDEQVEKLKPLYDEFNANVQKRADELREKGFQGLNFGEEMQKYQDSLKALAEKVKVHLNDEQKTKIDSRLEQMTGMMRMIPNLLNRNAGGAGGSARPSVEDRVRKAVDALKIEKEEEKSAVTDLVTKIVKAQYDLEDWTKSSRDRLSEASRNRELSDAAVEDRIKESQEERRKREKEITALQKQLTEVVTNRQELELMAQGILK